MPKASINLIKFCFYKIYTCSYLIIFVDKKLRMFPFIKNWNVYTIMIKYELVGNVIQVNTKYIYIFYVEKKQDKYINNVKIYSTNRYKDLNYIN